MSKYENVSKHEIFIDFEPAIPFLGINLKDIIKAIRQI